MASVSILDAISSRYEILLNRSPDADGLAFWMQEAQGGLTAAQIAAGAGSVSQATWNAIDAGFLNSTEFRVTDGHAGMGASDFVTFLYQNVLHRAPDSGGLSDWVAQLTSGGNSLAAQTAVVEGFLNSSEYLASHAVTPVALAAGQTYSLTSDGDFAVTAVAGPADSITIVGNGAYTVNTVMAPDSTVSITGSGNYTITADAGNNTITAGNGNDVITVGSGDNVITVGAGINAITASNGNGNNVIAFNASNGGSASSYTTITNTGENTMDNTETLIFHVLTIGGNTAVNVEASTASSVAAGLAAANLADGYNLFTVSGSQNTYLYEYTGNAATSELVALVGVGNVHAMTPTGASVVNISLNSVWDY